MANSPKPTRKSPNRRGKGEKQDQEPALDRAETPQAEQPNDDATAADSASQDSAAPGPQEADSSSEAGPPDSPAARSEEAEPDGQPFEPAADAGDEALARETAELSSDEPDTEPTEAPTALDDSAIGDTSPQPAAPEHGTRPAARVLALVIGGVLAASIGFAAAWYMERSGWPFAGRAELEMLSDNVAQNSERMADADTRISELRDSVTANTEAVAAAREIREDVNTLRAEIGSLENRLAEARGALRDDLDTMEARVGDLAARVDTVERMPIDADEAAEAAVSAYRRELAELRERIDATSARAETAIAEAESARAAAEERAAQAESRLEEQRDAAREAERDARAESTLRLVREAIESGTPYAAALDDLEQMGIEVPEPLAAHAESGVPSQAALEEGFPPAARDALSAARRELADTESLGGRLMAFLRTQLGSRSLSPRDGDDPDAILSRAEAALRNGDLSTALNEVDTLPEVGRAHMESWAAHVATRRTAEDALRELAEEIETP